MTLKLLQYAFVVKPDPSSLCYSVASVIRICYAFPTYIDGFRGDCRLCRSTKAPHLEKCYWSGAA